MLGFEDSVLSSGKSDVIAVKDVAELVNAVVGKPKITKIGRTRFAIPEEDMVSLNRASS